MPIFHLEKYDQYCLLNCKKLLQIKILPQKLTYPLKVDGWKIKYPFKISKWSLSRGHVSFRECSLQWRMPLLSQCFCLKHYTCNPWTDYKPHIQFTTLSLVDSGCLNQKDQSKFKSGPGQKVWMFVGPWCKNSQLLVIFEHKTDPFWSWVSPFWSWLSPNEERYRTWTELHPFDPERSISSLTINLWRWTYI